MTYNFEDSAVRKEAKRLHLIRRIDARPLTESEEAMATAFGKWDYQNKKQNLTPAQKEAIRKKVMKAVTDAGPTEMNQIKPDIIQNLFDIMKAVSTKDTVAHFDDLYNKCEIRYGDMKKQLTEDITNFLAPIREKIEGIERDEDYLRKVVKLGQEKARESAGKTIKEVREIIGFKKF